MNDCSQTKENLSASSNFRVFEDGKSLNERIQISINPISKKKKSMSKPIEGQKIDDFSDNSSEKSSNNEITDSISHIKSQTNYGKNSSDVWATIEVNGDNPDYPGQNGNEVRTTRYRWYTFIPMTLFEQYRVLSNIYYIFVLIISFLPMSPLSYLFQLIPMIIILIVSMVKSGVEDLIKHFDDKERNNAPAAVYRDGMFVKIKASEIKVGDILNITEDSMVPSDCLYIWSSQESHLCYFSETNLNGETAVKTMQPHPAFDHSNKSLIGTLKSDENDDNSYYSKTNKSQTSNDSKKSIDSESDDCTEVISSILSSKYYVDLPQPDKDLTQFNGRLRAGDNIWPISINNVLLRGSTTHYTDNVLGIVLRTGHDTKVMKNIRLPPAKLTKFDKNLNRILIIVFIFKMILCLVSTFVGVEGDKGEDFPLIKETYNSYGTSFLEYFTQYFVLYSYLFPVSLTVTIEIVRLFHKIIISYDPFLFDPEFGHGYAHNSNLIGQLGLITHILSDKTGTLTENKMELLEFSSTEGKFVASDFINAYNADESIVNNNLNLLFAMAVCNSVIVHKKKNTKIEYNADSPDEAAFVNFAAKCGIKLISRGLTTLSVDVCGKIKNYEIIALLPFNSDRKRMSIVIRQIDSDGLPTDDIMIFTKGADNIMSEKMSDFKEQDIVNEFASKGLRTLVFAMKHFSTKEIEKWINDYKNAESSLSNRDELIAAEASIIENDLTFIGITGVEDRLQSEVPETIEWFRRAQIKLWVLTGDKLETAIAIGKTSKIIPENSEMLIISATKEDDIEHQLDKFIENCSVKSFMNPVLIMAAEAVEYSCTKFVQKFITLTNMCESVILCRVSPYMKAQVAQVIKDESKNQILAIGDGANDVGMIQVSHVGVGVFGREGRQAAMNADFAIPRFKHIRRLLVVHGHWSYRRFATVAIIMIYKNIVFIFAQFWFSFFSIWSPTSYYTGFVMSCFNLIFTALPPFAFGFWEQDLEQNILLHHPELYKCDYDPMTNLNLLYYIILGLFQSLCSYFGPQLMAPNIDLYEVGILTYMIVVYTVVIQIIIWHNFHNWWTFGIYTINIVLAPIIIVIYCKFITYSLALVVEGAMSKGNFWLCFFVSVLFGLLPSFIFEYSQKRFRPSKIRLYSERFAEKPKKIEPHRNWNPNESSISYFETHSMSSLTTNESAASEIFSNDAFDGNDCNDCGDFGGDGGCDCGGGE